MRKLLLILSLITTLAQAAIVTPYPDTFELNQINGAEKERTRLCQAQKKYDKQPTGFYVEAGKTVEVNVEIITPADKNVMPVLTVGTLGFNVDNRNTGTDFTLTAGVNTITNHSGGLIWLSYIQNDPENPKGKAKITFTANSQHVRAPHYVFGVTTDVEFYEMYNAYPTPDVIFTSDYTAVVATREAALLYSIYNTQGTRLYDWMNAIHTLLIKEDEISGLNNADSNPVHHRLHAGEIRFLLTENTFTSPHANSAGYTGYPSGSRSRYLTKIGTPSNNTWMLGHEIGHQHQQPVYLVNKATESTVNIYSYVVERNIQGSTYNRTTATRWQQLQNTYLKLPMSKRIYDMPDDTLKAITGYNHDETRFMVWEQMFLIFGDDFYKTLHRVVREEKMSVGGSSDERSAYLIWKASQVTGYDLTEFYNLWGIRVADAAIKAKLRARIANALNNGSIIPLPRPAEDFIMVTGQNVPSWAKLPLRGITMSYTDEVFDRSDWTITTSYVGPTDATVGGDKPSYIIDNNSVTSFAFVKPGKTYGGVTPPADYIPSFTIDMKSVKEFNFVKYSHRTYGNTSNYLRARQISLYGSNDDQTYTQIVDKYTINYTLNQNDITLEFNPVSYRYIKLVIDDWDKVNGSTIQIQEFNVGTKVVEVLPTPDPLKYKVSVTAGDGVICSQTGVNLVNEDSNYTVNYTLDGNNSESRTTTLAVDGDVVTPTVSNGTYSYTVNVTNHVLVDISSKINTGVHTLAYNPLNIYPNPVRVGKSATIILDGNTQEGVITIYNVSGQKILQQQINKNNLEFAVENRGVYIIELKQSNLTYTSKLIVN